MKNLKRNAIVVVVLLFVCAAVYLNWSYNNRMGEAESISNDEQTELSPVDAQAEDAILDKSAAAAEDDKEEPQEEAEESLSDYFASARLTRQQSRDEAVSIWEQAASSETASQEVIDEAMSAISVMATNSLAEAQVENLLIAKDFRECVVFINDDMVTIAVPSPVEGLSEASVARITDVVSAETGMSPTQMRIIEVKD